jgi:Na+-transporting NADH:ubiquinone oxidoreductase subunit NqrF
LCTPLPFSIRATCPSHLILLDFITRTILCEQYRSLSSSLCNFLHSSVTPSLLDSKEDTQYLMINFIHNFLVAHHISDLNSPSSVEFSNCMLQIWYLSIRPFVMRL